MMKQLAVLVFVAIGLASAEYYTERTADKDFLLKQKKVYNLLYHVSQPMIVNPALYNEGQSYDIEANIDSYNNKEIVLDFLYHYKHGLLPRGEVFSVFYPRLLDQAALLFKCFYTAKDFDTFYKTALWARVYVNELQYVYALYQAVIHRPDTKYIQLPPLYEMYPYAFFNSEVLEKAHHAKIFGKLESKKATGGFDTYIIPANYSGWYINQDFDVEHRLNYFTEDIGLNTYYFYFRNQYPFWLKGEEYGLAKYRGEEYLYGHKQILARYYLERLSNDLGKMTDIDWYREFPVGYYPSMTYANGLPYPQRPNWSKFPYHKVMYIKALTEMESRISAAIDTGFVIEADGKKVNIYTPEGLNILGNMIEGNYDSCNLHLYGSIDSFARKILGFNPEPSTPYQIVPSALENFATSMRDPAFYRLYKRIYYYYYRYKQLSKPYTKEEIEFPELKIDSFAVDKLITYFDQFDASISNGLVVDDQKEAETFLIKARQYRLNHKPFTFHIGVNSDKPTRATIRIFLGPKYDVHRKLHDFSDSYRFFYEIDNWIVDLNAGLNKIERQSYECFFTIPDPESSEVFYKKLEKAIEGGEGLKYYERLYGFPERLILPKGKKEGMPFQLFIHVSPLTTEPMTYTSRVFGEYKFDNKPFGYPLDRPAYHYYFDGPNMMFKDIFIFHKEEADLNVTY